MEEKDIFVMVDNWENLRIFTSYLSVVIEAKIPSQLQVPRCSERQYPEE
jgi:hypothetical protein